MVGGGKKEIIWEPLCESPGSASCMLHSLITPQPYQVSLSSFYRWAAQGLESLARWPIFFPQDYGKIHKTLDKQIVSPMSAQVWVWEIALLSGVTGASIATTNRFMCAQSCPALLDPMGLKPPGSSVHRISQAGTPEWVVISSSRGYSRPRDWTQVSCVSCITGGFFTAKSLEEPTGSWDLLKSVEGKETKTETKTLSLGMVQPHTLAE